MKLPDFIRPKQIEEATGSLYEGKKQPEAKIVKSQYTREMPEKVTFQRLIEYHDATPQIRIAVSSYGELITGTEMIVTSEDDSATELINDWIRKTNFYDKFENLVTTLLICGNGLLEKLSENDIEDVEEVDMGTIIAKKRSDIGELEYYEQRQQQGKIVRLGEKGLDRFIEFNLTQYSKQAWGRSLFYPLAIPRTTGGRTMAPFVEVMWAAEDAIGAILNNDAYPIKTVTYPGANDTYLEKEAEKWRRYKPGDWRIQKIKPEFEFHESDHSAGRYEPHWNHLEKTFELGTQFPHDILTGDFTSRASSETTENIVMKLVRGYQRYLCNKLKKELFEPILEQSGYKSDDVELELTFTAENIIELDPSSVLDIRRNGDMTRKEYREWLRKNTGMELDAQFDEKDPEQEELMKQNMAAQNGNNVAQKKQDESIKALETRLEALYNEKSTDEKIAEMHAKMERKLDLVKESADNNNNGQLEKRISSLKRMLDRVEELDLDG